MDYAALIGLGIQFIQGYLIPAITKKKGPQELIDALTAGVAALELHRADVVTKAAIEAQRA